MTQGDTTMADPPRRGAPLPTVWAFGTMGAPMAAMLVVTNVYLPRYYAGLGLGLVAIGAAVTLVRLFDLALDPLVSLAMDRTRTPLGRYRPWLIGGAPLVMLALHMLLEPQGEPTTAYLGLWLVVAFAGYSMITLGMAAWAAVLATSYADRARVYGWLGGLSAVGQAGILLLPPLVTHGQVQLGKPESMATIGWILVGTIPITLAICTVFTPERIAAQAQRPRFSFRDISAAVSRPEMLRVIAADFMTALGPGASAPLYLFFFHIAKGFDQAQINLLLTFTIGSSMLGAPAWGRIAQRLNKHRTVQLACVCYIVCHTAVVFMPRGLFPASVVAMSAVGFCSAAFVPLVRAMVADINDEVRLERGQNLTSLMFSMVTTTQKIGSTITVLIVFPILAWVGFNGKEGAVNTDHAILGLQACYLLFPVTGVFVGGLIFIGYKLSPERHAAVRAALDARDAAEAAAEAPAAAALQSPAAG